MDGRVVNSERPGHTILEGTYLLLSARNTPHSNYP